MEPFKISGAQFRRTSKAGAAGAKQVRRLTSKTELGGFLASKRHGYKQLNPESVKFKRDFKKHLIGEGYTASQAKLEARKVAKGLKKYQKATQKNVPASKPSGFGSFGPEAPTREAGATRWGSQGPSAGQISNIRTQYGQSFVNPVGGRSAIPTGKRTMPGQRPLPPSGRPL